MGSDRLGALAATGNLDHHFRGMPDGARDLLDLSRQQPQLPFRGSSAPVAHDVQERTVAALVNYDAASPEPQLARLVLT